MKSFRLFFGHFSGLSKRMLFYFSLIAFANVFVVAEVAWEISSDNFRDNVVQEVNSIKNENQPAENIYILLNKIMRKFLIMVLILIIVSAVVMYLFLIRIASPLQYMIEQADKMSEGDLRNRIEISTHDEIAVLGKLINDLSINLQELISQLNKQTNDLNDVKNSFKNKILRHHKLEKYFSNDLVAIERILQGFQIIENYYKLYSINSNIISTSDSNIESGKS